MKWLNPWELPHALNLFSLDIALLSLNLLLLLSELFVHLHERHLEQAVEPALLQLRHRPLYHDVHLLLLVRLLHLEFSHHEGLLLLEVVFLVRVLKDGRGRGMVGAVGKKGLRVIVLARGRDDNEELALLVFLFQSP